MMESIYDNFCTLVRAYVGLDMTETSPRLYVVVKTESDSFYGLITALSPDRIDTRDKGEGFMVRVLDGTPIRDEPVRYSELLSLTFAVEQ